MELLHAFGIDYKILIAQTVNFAILFFVLYKVGYKPIFSFLEERQNRIKSGLAMAEKAEANLSAAVEEKNAVIADAKKEANAIVAKASEAAKLRGDEMIAQAKGEIAAIIEKEKEKIREERARTTREIKAEVADLIALSLEKITGEKIDPEKDRDLIKKALGNG